MRRCKICNKRITEERYQEHYQALCEYHDFAGWWKGGDWKDMYVKRKIAHKDFKRGKDI